MIKIAVFTVMLPEYDLQQTAAALAEKGYDGVEWRVTRIDPSKADQPPSYWGNNRSTVDVETIGEKALEIRAMSDATGLEICNLACYEPGDAFERIEKIMQAARKMGVRSMRVGVPRYDRTRPYPELLQEARRNLWQIEKLAKKYGVKGLIEIHMGTITPSASAACRAVEGFDPDAIGVILDPGNMVNEGWEAWRLGMEALGPYLAHVHAKNYRWVVSHTDEKGTVHWKPEAVPIPEGLVDWGLVIDDLHKVGYDGWISFEDFSAVPTDEKLIRNLAYIRQFTAHGAA